MKKIFILFIAFFGVLSGCKKPELADNDATGEGLVPFSLKTPSSGTNLVLNAATPAATIDITWNPSTPGLHTAPTYNWIAALKATGNLDNPVISIPSGNNGADAKLTLTYKQLDDALKAAGIADGAKADLIWSIQADNGSTKIVAQNTFNLSVTRFKDGVTPFSILGPSSSTAPLTINPNSTSDSLTFNWTKALPASGTTGLKYRVVFYKDDGSATPLFSINSRNNGVDSLFRISYKDFSDTLTKYGFTNVASVANLKWTIAATSGSWTQMSDFVNQLYVAREVKLYLVGGSTLADWTPTNALRFIEDESRTGVFYIYTKLTTAGFGFKFLSDNVDWSDPSLKVYGDVDGSGTSGNLTVVGGGNNINTPAGDGVYRITVDMINNKYYVQKQFGRMALVGGGTPADWNPGAAFTSQEMGFASTNLFIGIVNVTSNGEFKPLDNSDWPNGNLDYTRDYEDAGNGKIKESGGDNFKWTGTAGPVRFIWDYRDVKNPTYVMNAATEMRVVGNGINGVAEWNPGASPQMTYIGNGKWQITLNLIGDKEIKFLAGNDWGAFDYEDASGGSTATGTPRKIKWEGGDNFRTPATSGTYTITLDEYAQTVTIN
jgi:hypothetical protein